MAGRGSRRSPQRLLLPTLLLVAATTVVSADPQSCVSGLGIPSSISVVLVDPSAGAPYCSSLLGSGAPAPSTVTVVSEVAGPITYVPSAAAATVLDGTDTTSTETTEEASEATVVWTTVTATEMGVTVTVTDTTVQTRVVTEVATITGTETGTLYYTYTSGTGTKYMKRDVPVETVSMRRRANACKIHGRGSTTPSPSSQEQSTTVTATGSPSSDTSPSTTSDISSSSDSSSTSDYFSPTSTDDTSTTSSSSNPSSTSDSFSPTPTDDTSSSSDSSSISDTFSPTSTDDTSTTSSSSSFPIETISEACSCILGAITNTVSTTIFDAATTLTGPATSTVTVPASTITVTVRATVTITSTDYDTYTSTFTPDPATATTTTDTTTDTTTSSVSLATPPAYKIVFRGKTDCWDSESDGYLYSYDSDSTPVEPDQRNKCAAMCINDPSCKSFSIQQAKENDLQPLMECHFYNYYFPGATGDFAENYCGWPDDYYYYYDRLPN